MKLSKVMDILKQLRQTSDNVFESDKATFTIVRNSGSDKVLSVLYHLKSDNRDTLTDYNNGMRLCNLKEVRLFANPSVIVL